MPTENQRVNQQIATRTSIAVDAAITMETNGGYWGYHPIHLVADWRYEVDNEDTRQGYWEWVVNQIEAKKIEEE
jgi:hypothetical protein